MRIYVFASVCLCVRVCAPMCVCVAGACARQAAHVYACVVREWVRMRVRLRVRVGSDVRACVRVPIGLPNYIMLYAGAVYPYVCVRTCYRTYMHRGLRVCGRKSDPAHRDNHSRLVRTHQGPTYSIILELPTPTVR